MTNFHHDVGNQGIFTPPNRLIKTNSKKFSYRKIYLETVLFNLFLFFAILFRNGLYLEKVVRGSAKQISFTFVFFGYQRERTKQMEPRNSFQKKLMKLFSVPVNKNLFRNELTPPVGYFLVLINLLGGSEYTLTKLTNRYL